MAPTLPSNAVSVRAWFRQMRTADHLRDAGAFDAIRTYARGQHVIVFVNAFDPAARCTLFDRDVPEGIDVEAAAREIHFHWGGRRERRYRQMWAD